MFRKKPSLRSARQEVPADHHFEHFTDFCTRCGAHRSSVWLSEWPLHCPAGANVIGISHLLALRHVAWSRSINPRARRYPTEPVIDVHFRG